MYTKDFNFGRRGLNQESKTAEDVHEAITKLPPGRPTSRHSADDEPTLFDLANCLRRLDLIDEAKRAADQDSEQRALHLSPARFANLRDVVVRAFSDVRDGCSADRLVADEMLNDEFLRRCWELGALATAYELNWCLLNARKAGALQVPGDTRRFVIPANRLNEFTFATEFSIRHIQEFEFRDRGRSVSLDRILCDSQLATRFDETAKRLAPGYSSLEYRWAAFTIRKARRPSPVSYSDGFESVGDTRAVRASRLPTDAGVYRFVSGEREMYVGETDNLRRQISIHFENNGTCVFPDWLYPGVRDVRLLIAPMPKATSMAERSRAKTFFTDRWSPQLNWLGRQLPAA
jgi:site-specific DNA-methyltransferase (adenine-specific)